jgi:hypothetical protein
MPTNQLPTAGRQQQGGGGAAAKQSRPAPCPTAGAWPARPLAQTQCPLPTRAHPLVRRQHTPQRDTRQAAAHAVARAFQRGRRSPPPRRVDRRRRCPCPCSLAAAANAVAAADVLRPLGLLIDKELAPISPKSEVAYATINSEFDRIFTADYPTMLHAGVGCPWGRPGCLLGACWGLAVARQEGVCLCVVNLLPPGGGGGGLGARRLPCRHGQLDCLQRLARTPGGCSMGCAGSWHVPGRWPASHRGSLPATAVPCRRRHPPRPLAASAAGRRAPTAACPPASAAHLTSGRPTARRTQARMQVGMGCMGLGCTRHAEPWLSPHACFCLRACLAGWLAGWLDG